MLHFAVLCVFSPTEFLQTRRLLSLIERSSITPQHVMLYCNGKFTNNDHAKINGFNLDVELHGGIRNIGIARARNKLISMCRENLLDLYFFLDNDIYIPENYFDKLVNSYSQLVSSGVPVGVISSRIVDYNKICPEEFLGGNDAAPLAESYGHLEECVASRMVDDIYYHLGVMDWERVYLQSPYIEEIKNYKLFRNYFKFIETIPFDSNIWLAGSPKFREQIDPFNCRDEYVEVSTIPGGACLIDRSLVADGFRFSPQFTPFGFEDSDFCLSVLEQGRKNYLALNCFCIHDLEKRGVNRPKSVRYFTEGKMKRIFLCKRKYVRSTKQRYLRLLDSILGYPKHISLDNAESRNGSVYLLAYWLGFLFLPKRKLADLWIFRIFCTIMGRDYNLI